MTFYNFPVPHQESSWRLSYGKKELYNGAESFQLILIISSAQTQFTPVQDTRILPMFEKELRCGIHHLEKFIFHCKLFYCCDTVQFFMFIQIYLYMIIFILERAGQTFHLTY